MATQVKEMKHKEGQEENLIHLYIDEENLGDSVAPIRWCVCQEIFDRLKEEKARDPYLLLVVAHDKKECYEEVSRRIIPLDQMMDFIQFKGKGKHKILATVLWSGHTSIGMGLKRTFLGKDSYGHYTRNVLDIYNGKLCDLRSFDFEQIGETELEVEVAKELFAKEPPKWLKNWVNWFYSTLSVDQCQFRRRCIFAFTIQSSLALIATIFLVLLRIIYAVFLLLRGMRDINFRPIIHPWKKSTNEMLDWLDKKSDKYVHCSSIFLRTKDGEKKSPFLAPFVVVGPLFVFSLIILRIVGSCGVGVSWLNSWRILLIIVAISLGAVLILTAILIINILCEKLGLKWLAKEIERLQGEWQVKKKEAREKRYVERFSPIICPGISLEANLSAIPKEKKTIYLKFMDLKRKVCKPFARY